MRFLLPHPTFRRYYLGERVTVQFDQGQFVPNDPPVDMLDGTAMVIEETHYSGVFYVSLIDWSGDYSDFRASRLMPKIGSRFSSQGSQPPVTGPSQGTGSQRHYSSAAERSDSAPRTQAAEAGGSTLRPMRAPPSIAQAAGPLDAVLASIRLPYDLSYRSPTGISQAPIHVAEPDRSLPIAQITQVIQMITYAFKCRFLFTYANFDTGTRRPDSRPYGLHCRHNLRVLLSSGYL